MKKWAPSRLLTAIIILATAQLGWAQVNPPDRSQIHSSSTMVRFSWPGDKSDWHFLEVYASGREMYRGDIKGNSTAIQLPLGPKYQWKVSKQNSAGYTTIGEYSFQSSGDLTFDFNGGDGAAGASGRDGAAQSFGVSSQSEVSGNDGKQGADGGKGRDVTVELKPDGDFVQVNLTSPNGSESFLLDKSSAPILIQATGGHGGSGGRGGDGAASYYVSTQQGASYPAGAGRPAGNSGTSSGTYPAGVGRPAGNSSSGAVGWQAPPAYVYPPGSGGNGGQGGNGGDGGTVTVISSGVDAKRYVQVQNEGGLAGVGGGPGRGGPATSPGTVPAGSTGYIGQAGRAGQQGQAGRDGRSGKVVYR